MQRAITTNLKAIRQDRWETGRPGTRGRYTQEALAAELKISVRAYAALEKGEGAVDLDRLLQLARYLDVSPLDLLVPGPGDDQMLIQVRPRGGRPHTVEAVSVDEFVSWWRSTAPLGSQHRWRWLTGRGRRRSDIGFADSRFVDAESRVEGRRLPGGKIQEGRQLVSEPLEVPERPRVHMMLEKFWAACADDNDDEADRALDAIYEALNTGCRRAQGDPDPEAPVWRGRRLPMVAQEEIADERED